MFYFLTSIIYFMGGIVYLLLHHIRRYIISAVSIFVISGFWCSQPNASQPFTKLFGKHQWPFPRVIISIGAAKQWWLSSFIPSAFTGWNSFIKQTLLLSAIWVTWITVFQERQNKCLFLYLYQPIFRMNLCPHILQKWSKRFLVFTFSYHFAIMDFNVFHEFQYISVIFLFFQISLCIFLTRPSGFW